MDQIETIIKRGKITKLVAKLDVDGRKISMVIDRPIGGDEATVLRFPAGKSRRVGGATIQR